MKHALTLAVAAASVAIALADGGYYPSGFGTFSLVCWAIVIVGLAAGFLPRAELPRAAIIAGSALAALAALTALSMAWTTDQGAAFDDAIRVLGYTGLFLLVVIASRSGDAPAWLRGLAIGTTVVAGLALLARLEPSLLGHPERELAAQVPTEANRLSWPIGYWNGLAALLAVSVGLLDLARRLRRHARRPHRRDRRPASADARPPCDDLAWRPDRRRDRDRRAGGGRAKAPAVVAERRGRDRRRRHPGRDRVRARRPLRPAGLGPGGEPGRRGAGDARRGTAGRRRAAVLDRPLARAAGGADGRAGGRGRSSESPRP